MDREIHISHGLHGDVSVPGDKSISHRALLIGSLAEGTTTIEGLSDAADVNSTLTCLQTLGVRIDREGSRTTVHGKGPHGFLKPGTPLDAGNSGTTMRLMSGILSGQRFDSVITGDASLSQRPMRRVMEPLRLMGANINGTERDTAPLTISSTYHLHPIDYELPVASAQVKSAVLFAGLFADGTTRVTEQVATRDHTERMLGLKILADGTRRTIEVNGGHKLRPRAFVVPGDISAATFLIAAAALVPDSQITVHNVGLNETRSEILETLRSLNVSAEITNVRSIEGERTGDIVVRSSQVNSNVRLDGAKIALLIDEIPMLAVLALFGEGTFSVRNASELRYKETDRIKAIVVNLRSLGVEVQEFDDGFAFDAKNRVFGRELESFGDHRIAMAFGVAGLRIPGITIKDADCVNISFPGFWNAIQPPSHQ